MGNPVLNFGRVLGRAKDLHVGALAGRGDRDLSFEIEMVLTAAAQFAVASSIVSTAGSGS